MGRLHGPRVPAQTDRPSHKTGKQERKANRPSLTRATSAARSAQWQVQPHQQAAGGVCRIQQFDAPAPALHDGLHDG